jgi:hypothetical protein
MSDHADTAPIVRLWKGRCMRHFCTTVRIEVRCRVIPPMVVPKQRPHVDMPIGVTQPCGVGPPDEGGSDAYCSANPANPDHPIHPSARLIRAMRWKRLGSTVAIRSPRLIPHPSAADRYHLITGFLMSDRIRGRSVCCVEVTMKFLIIL